MHLYTWCCWKPCRVASAFTPDPSTREGLPHLQALQGPPSSVSSPAVPWPRALWKDVLPRRVQSTGAAGPLKRLTVNVWFIQKSVKNNPATSISPTQLQEESVADTVVCLSSFPLRPIPTRFVTPLQAPG